MSAQPSKSLKTQPNWHAAAQALIDSLSVQDHDDERMDFLETLCHDLGKQLYPAFIHMLYFVEKSGTRRAHELIGNTLVGCLLSGRLPSGETSAWGAGVKNSLPGNQAGGFSHQRRLGPIEYIIAWHMQSGTASELTNQQFTEALSSLLRLVNADEKAALLYRQHIEFQLSDPVGGVFDQATRNALQSLCSNWANNLAPHNVADLCLQSHKPARSLSDLVPC